MKYFFLISAFLFSVLSLGELKTTDTQSVDNFVQNGGFELGKAKWYVYKNSTSAIPTTCFGGSPTVTVDSTTNSPISGKASGLFIKPASNVQGEGYATDIVLDKSARTAMINIEGMYEILSGTYSGGSQSTDSDLAIYIYDPVDNRLIQPSGYKLDGGVQGITYSFAPVQFQAPQFTTDTRTLRLCIHHATTSASAFQIKSDKIKVNLQTKSTGSPATASQSYTPTSQGLGSINGVNFTYRIVADSVEIEGKLGSGTSTSDEMRIGLPPGMVASSSYSANTAVGDIFKSSPTADQIVALIDPGASYLTFGIQNGTSGGLNKVLGTNIAASGQVLSVKAKVKIQGLGSTMALSDSTDARPFLFQGYVASNQSLTANTTDLVFTAIKDTHGCLTSAGCKVSVPGDYIVGGSLNFAASATLNIFVYVNGTQKYALMRPSSSLTSPGFVTVPDLKAGDVISLRSDTGVTVQGNAAYTISIIRQQTGSQQIAQLGKIRAIYSKSASGSVTASTQINMDSKVEDTHNAVTTGAGVWKFTSPRQAVCQISGKLPSTGDAYVQLYKNNSLVTEIGVMQVVGAYSNNNLNYYISLNANEWIDVRPSSTVNIIGGASSQLAIVCE